MSGSRILLDTNVALYLLRGDHGLKIPDAIIGATAIYLNLTLLTADRGFERLGEVLTLLMYEV